MARYEFGSAEPLESRVLSPAEAEEAATVVCAMCGQELPLIFTVEIEHDCQTGYVGPA